MAQDAHCLRLASEALKDDKELILKAVRLKGNALQFASERLQGDKEVVLTAVAQQLDTLNTMQSRL